MCSEGCESAEGGEEEALPRVGGKHGETSRAHLETSKSLMLTLMF